MATRPGGPFDWRIWRHDAVAAFPGLAPQWLARDLLPLGFAHSSRNNKIARPAKRSTEGHDYLSVKLDEPSFSAPIYANLFDDWNGETFSLIWSSGRNPNGD
jgi:hypothetical protein